MTQEFPKYELAKEQLRWVHTPVVVKTNCIDKTDGHSWDWVEDKNTIEEIFRQHPRFHRGVPCIICRKCKKVSQSM